MISHLIRPTPSDKCESLSDLGLAQHTGTNALQHYVPILYIQSWTKQSPHQKHQNAVMHVESCPHAPTFYG